MFQLLKADIYYFLAVPSINMAIMEMHLLKTETINVVEKCKNRSWTTSFIDETTWNIYLLYMGNCAVIV